MAFDFIICNLSDLNSNPNNLVEILFINVLFVDCLMLFDVSLPFAKLCYGFQEKKFFFLSP